MNKIKNVVLSGRVYGAFNTLKYLSAIPSTLEAGDLIVWPRPGANETLAAQGDCGEFYVSVFDGKARRRVKRSKSGIKGRFMYASEAQREERLRQLVPQLVAFGGGLAERVAWGWIISPSEQPPALIAPHTRLRGRIKPGIRADSPEPSVPYVVPEQLALL